MRVLHVIDKSELGGGQTAVRHLLESLASTGCETQLCCRGGGPLETAALELGTPVHSVPFDKRFRPGPARAVAKIARSERMDLVHAHGLVAAFYCVLARQFFGLSVPVLYHQHGFHHHNYGSRTVGLRKRAERWVCRKVDRVIPVSQADEAELASGDYAPREHLKMLHYGIPEPRSSEADLEAARLRAEIDGRPCVGLVGRLHPQKGIDILIHAADRVRQTVPDVRFVIVGDGPLEAELHALTTKLGLDDHVVWAGGRPAAPFLPLFDVAVISSHWEGMPLTLLEYMAAGRAIITTDLPGCTEASAGAAVVVPRNDPDALAAKLIHLLRNPEEATHYRLAARDRFLVEFSLERMAERFTSLYKEVLA
jgi:glycosyltransferase involved in cell wall biosynthesis